jgi:hypothetical protein
LMAPNQAAEGVSVPLSCSVEVVVLSHSRAL